MRFYTEEWFNAVQLPPPRLRACERAERFDEDFFLELYARKKAKWLRKMRRLCAEDGEEFDAAAEGADFDAHYRWRLELLSEEIYAPAARTAADMRILALGMAAPGVKAEFDRIWRTQQRRIKRTACRAQRSRAQFDLEHPGFPIRAGEFHDWRLEDADREGENLTLTLSMEGNRCRICLSDCEILRMDAEIPGSEWLYEEVYPAGDGNELHVLLFRWGDDPLRELLLRMKDVRVEKETA